MYFKILRIIGALIALYLVYTYFYKDIRFQALYIELKQLNGDSNILFLLFAILLMPINWYLESWKWRSVMLHQHKISKRTAFWSIFQGVSLGIITPGRLGEYGGRIVRLQPEYRAFGALATFICSLAQNIINISIGFIGLIWITSINLINVQQYNSIIITGIIILVLISVCLFKLSTILSYFTRFPWSKKWISDAIIDFISSWKSSSKWSLLGIALLRYMTYSFQYIFVLLAFSIDLSLWSMMMGVAVIFAIQTLLPLTPLLQFTVRGSIALFILGTLSQQEDAVFLASYSMWFLNLLVPAIIGAIFLLLAKRKSKILE